jgi:hypothetical protein
MYKLSTEEPCSLCPVVASLEIRGIYVAFKRMIAVLFFLLLPLLKHAGKGNCAEIDLYYSFGFSFFASLSTFHRT